MSYSFRFTVATKEEAKTKAAQELAAVVALQPNHEKDCAAALANVEAALALLCDDGTQDIRVDCHGSLTWITNPEKIIGAQVAANVWHVPKGTE